MTHDATPPRQRGFTVLEALISLVIFLAVVTAVLSSYTPSRYIYLRGQHRTDVQQNARLAMAEMARQVRMAGYFPENYVLPEPATPLANPIRVATDDALSIYGDIDSDGSSGVVTYCLDGTTLRRASGAVGSAGSYTCAGGQPLAENVTELSFVYYDVDGNPVPDPPSGSYALDEEDLGSVAAVDDVAERGTIRRVLVALTTESEAPGRGPQVFTVTSNVWLRNVQ
jgi:type II secretory pathway pseudopilin PulG